MSTSVSGGDPSPIKTSLPNPELDDLSSDGSRLLITSHEPGRDKLWTYDFSSRSLRFVDGGLIHAVWAPNGHAFAASVPARLAIRISDGDNRREIPVGQIPQDLAWSPDGKTVRFSLLSDRSDAMSEWEVAAADGRLRRLTLPTDGQPFIRAGTWSHDGRHFFYLAGAPGHHWDIWVSPVNRYFSSLLPTKKPFRLTNSIGVWGAPAATSDSSTILPCARPCILSYHASTLKRSHGSPNGMARRFMNSIFPGTPNGPHTHICRITQFGRQDATVASG